MWAVKLVDIGGNGLVVELTSTLETLAEVEFFVVNVLYEKLGVAPIHLVHTDELVYGVWLNGHEIGVVSIKDVNPAPLKRK